MSRENWTLDIIQIASPCSASWDNMRGDELVRFCSDCKLNVYNISDMTREEATSLIQRNEGGLCGRFYRRADGTILTRDCPVGVWEVRKRLARVVAAAAALVAFLASGTVFALSNDPNRRRPNGPLSKLMEWLDPYHGVPVWGSICPPTVTLPVVIPPAAESIEAQALNEGANSE